MNHETEVLRETVARVESLTEDITSLTKSIDRNASQALDNLRPFAQHANACDDLNTNIRNVIAVLEELKVYTSTIEQQAQVINGGIEVAGPEVYGRTWRELEDTLRELTSSNHRQFYGLIEQIHNLQLTAEQMCQDAVRRDAERVFPIDPTDQPENADIASLKEIYEFATQHNQQKATNVIVVNQINKMAAGAVSSQKVESAVALKKFKAFARQYVDHQRELLLYLFPERQALEYCSLVEVIFSSEEAQLTRKVDKLNAGKQKGDMHMFEEIEASIQFGDTDEPQKLDVLYEEGAKRMAEFFLQIDQLTKNQRIENELGFSDATERAARLIRRIAEHQAGILASLQKRAPRFYLPTPAPSWLKGFAITNKLPNLLELYCADIFENLFQNLLATLQKSGRPPTQQGLVLMINTSFMKHFIESNRLGSMIGALGGQRLDKIHNQGVKLYLADWQRLSQCLMDPTQTKPGAKLSSKDREAVKERFRQFNTEFEVLSEKQRKMAIPDKELRQEMTNAISQIIRPLYKRFYDKHSGGDFTKNLDKYVKYDPAKLDEVLARM